MIIGKWVGEFDRAQATRVFHNESLFDETTMLDDLEPSARPSSDAAWAGITEPHHAANVSLPVAAGGAKETKRPRFISSNHQADEPRASSPIHYPPRKKK